MILVVGQNPAKGRGGELPFYGTRSGRLLVKWFKDAGADLTRCVVVNLWNTEGKLPPASVLRMKAQFIVDVNDVDKYVLVGKVADRYVRPLIPKKEVLTLPHPSGLNRQLNDKKFQAKIIKQLQEFLYSVR